MKHRAFVTSLLIMAGFGAPQQRAAQAANRTAQQKKLCIVQGEEAEVFASYLEAVIGSPHVLVTKTGLPDFVDVDALNLQLAAQGRGIPRR